MSWAEFRIRLHGYKRSQLKEKRLHRELLWTVYTSPYQDPKKMARSIEKFYPLEGDNKVPDAMLEAIKERSQMVKEKYLKEKNG